MRVRKSIVFAALLLAIPGTGLPAGPVQAEGPSAASAQAREVTLSGQILGVSKKAKTIAIKSGDSTEMVRFNEATRGMEFAEKGESAIIAIADAGGERMATEVRPKLVKLPDGATEIQPEDLASLIARGGGDLVLIDARPAKRFAEAAIPTAVSVPVDALKEKGEALLPADKKTPLVFYCGGPICGMSTDAAGLAIKWGYGDVRVLVKGLPGWKKAGQLAVAANDFVTKGNVVIIDLRRPEEAAKGFIPRAVNIPASQLEGVRETLPKVKSVPIVFYGTGEEPRAAIQQLAEWGYKNTSVVNGGLEGWLKSGGELATGTPGQKIAYKREIEKGEVSAEDFRKALQGGAGDVVILDVRNGEETTEGRFPQAISIPLDQVEKRMAELPRDKEILAHCTTGDRAAMAAEQLRKAGFTVRHLVAGVTCTDGACSIGD